MIPKIEITENGYKVPTTQQINEGVWSILAEAMGVNISRVQGTPQYQLATSFTAIIRDAYDKQVALANQFDPRYADGIYQDALGEIYFTERKRATSSTCMVTFTGLVGATIPANFSVQDTSGRIWNTTGVSIIQSAGSVTATVQCSEQGAISAAPNTLTIIVSAISGVDSVTNNASAITGYNEESRSNFEVRRQESVASNAKMTDNATRGAVASLENVLDVYVYSNPSDETITTGSTNYPLIRNSIVVSVVGGVDYDIAKQVLIKAGTGCSFNGNTEVTVFDTDTYPTEPPEYKVKFLRPTNTPIYWRVKLINTSRLSYNDEVLIKNTILSGMKEGSTRARIGQKLISSPYIAKISNAISLEIESIEISLDNTTWVNVLSIGIDQYPVSDAFHITVV